MSLRGLLQILRTRWYVLLAALVVTGVIGFLFARDGGLYVTRTVVTLEVPDAAPWVEEGGSKDSGVITLAAIIAQQVNGGREPVNYSSADAPYYGAGVRQGVKVGLPDTGGQWGVTYMRAAIEVNVVSPDYSWVHDNQQAALAEVLAAADAHQSGIAAASRIRVAVQPLTTTIEHVVPSRLSLVLAAGALAAVGLLVGGWAAVTVDSRSMSRREGGRYPADGRIQKGEATS